MFATRLYICIENRLKVLYLMCAQCDKGLQHIYLNWLRFTGSVFIIVLSWTDLNCSSVFYKLSFIYFKNFSFSWKFGKLNFHEKFFNWKIWLFTFLSFFSDFEDLNLFIKPWFLHNFDCCSESRYIYKRAFEL